MSKTEIFLTLFSLEKKKLLNGCFDSLMTLNNCFLPHCRGLLEVQNRRQPVDRIAIMLSAIQCWLRQIQTGIYLKRISLKYGMIACFPLLFQSQII